MKITPAHDHNDYEVGKKHTLPFITVISEDGIIIGDCAQFTVEYICENLFSIFSIVLTIVMCNTPQIVRLFFIK